MGLQSVCISLIKEYWTGELGLHLEGGRTHCDQMKKVNR